MNFIRFLGRHLAAAFFGALGILALVLGYADQAMDIWAVLEPWHLQAAGAALFVLSIISIMYRWDQEHQTRSADAASGANLRPSEALNPVVRDRPRQALPTPEIAPKKQTSEADVEERVFVGPNITAGSLMEMCQGKTEIQGNRLISVYLDKWLRVMGTIRNISETSQGLYVAVEVPFMFEGRPNNAIVWMTFEDDRNYLEMMQRGDAIEAIGRIERIKPVSLDLVKCRLILSDAL